MKQPIKLSLAIALALGSPAAWALGLGGITVKSGLNEPLVAEIAINEAAPGEAEGMRANLASAEDFARVGLDLSGVAVPLRFDVVKDAGGRAVIQVSSESPVREPFLSFLVEVSWSNGRLLREYAVLLDPPVVAPAVIGTRTVVEPVREAAPAPAPEPLPPSTRDAAPQAAAPPPQPAAPVTTPEPAPVAPAPAPAPVASTPGEYGPVAAGETLWEIATATRPEGGVTLNQMMLAILRANPDAFIRGNVNALKRGAVLRIPAADEARAVAIADAAAEIAAQNDAWRGNVRPTLVADGGTPAPEGSSPAATPARDDSRLELVPPRAGAGGGASGADRPGAAGGTDTALVRADLARAREQLASREQEAGELRSRVQELERIQEDKDRLVNLKSSEIAALQQRLKEMQEQIERDRAAQAGQVAAAPVAEPVPAAVEPAPVPVEPAPVVESPVAETPAPEPAPVDAEPTAIVDGAPTEPAVTDPATTEPVAEVPAEAEVTPVPEAEPAPAVAFEDAPATPWWRENLMLIGASGALLLGGLLLLALRGRRKAPAAAPAGRSPVSDSFGAGVFGGAAAAEAFGEDDEAALLDQLASDPTDLEAHLALLRHYHAAGEVEKFEGAADAMYAQVIDPQAPAWVEACMMGRELLPGHALFEAAVPAEGGDYDFDQNDGAAQAREPDFDFGSAEVATTEPARDDDPFDVSLDEPVVSKADIVPPSDVRQRADDIFRTAEFAAPTIDAPAIPEPPAADAGFYDGDDAVGTKLDLARAYLDMGDPEGARSMLQEVISEGSEAQRQEARRLLAEIG